MCLVTSPVGAVAKYCDDVMSTSVCLSDRQTDPVWQTDSLWVCLSVCPWAYPRSHTHGFYQIGRGSVLLRQGDEIPRRRGSYGGFLPHWQCIVTRLLQITSCSSRRDHSVNARGWWECTDGTGKVWSMIVFLSLQFVGNYLCHCRSVVWLIIIMIPVPLPLF